MDNLKVGQYIKKRIKEKGITQDQLAEMMNITSSAISQVLNGKNMFDITNFQTLSRILDEPIDTILNAGEEPPTDLELLAKTTIEEYKREDPNLEKSQIKDRKGKSLFEYIIKHKNIELIRLYKHQIIAGMPNDIRLLTILIESEEVELLGQMYHSFRFESKFDISKEITDFTSNNRNKYHINVSKDNQELSSDEIDYLKALTKNRNIKIFDITGALRINQNNINYFSKLVEYAIIFDEVDILKIDHERRVENIQQQPGLEHAIEIKFSKLLKKSIENKSEKSIEYCYSMLTSFDLQRYFIDLIETKDKDFIKEFVSKYKNKSMDRFNTTENRDSKFNNFESLKQLIESNNIEILEYSIEFSTQQALDEALFITKGNQLEIIKLLITKGARFMIQDTYSSSNRIVQEQLTTMVKYLFDELNKKQK